jgi:hypothetical protein
MNNKPQENGTLTGPLIFTLSLLSLNLDWLDGTTWAAVFVETRDWERDRLQFAQPLLEARSPRHVLRRGQRTNCCSAQSPSPM